MKQQSWIEITAIQLGGAICLPVIYIGFQLGRDLGLGIALLCLMGASLFLFLLSLLGARLAAESKRSTIETVELFFGKKGKSFFAALMIGSLLLWFALQAQMASSNLFGVVEQLGYRGGKELFCLCVTLVMVGVPLFGLGAISKVADLTVPFMFAAMCVAALQHIMQGSLIQMHPSLSSCAMNVCFVVAANIIAVCDMPTFFRHAQDPSHARKAAVATFLIGIPAVEAIGVLIGAFSHEIDFLDALCPSDGFGFKIGFALFIFFAALTTNNGNFYSANATFEPFEKIKGIYKKLLLALLFTLVSSFPIYDNFETVLSFFGLFWVSLGASLFASYMVKMRGKPVHQLTTWLAFLIGLGCSLVVAYFQENMAMLCGFCATVAAFFSIDTIVKAKEKIDVYSNG